MTSRHPLLWLVLLAWLGCQALLCAPSQACDNTSETPKNTKVKGK